MKSAYRNLLKLGKSRKGKASVPPLLIAAIAIAIIPIIATLFTDSREKVSTPTVAELPWCLPDPARTSYDNPCSPDGSYDCAPDGKQTVCVNGLTQATGQCCAQPVADVSITLPSMIETNFSEKPDQISGAMDLLPIDGNNPFFELTSNGTSFSPYQVRCEYVNGVVKSGNLYTISGLVQNVNEDSFTLLVGDNQYVFRYDSKTTYSEWEQYNFCDVFYKIYPASEIIQDTVRGISGSQVTIYFNENSSLANLYAFHIAGSKKVQKTILGGSQ